MKNIKKIISLILVVLLLNLHIIPPTIPMEEDGSPTQTMSTGGGFGGENI